MHSTDTVRILKLNLFGLFRCSLAVGLPAVVRAVGLGKSVCVDQYK